MKLSTNEVLILNVLQKSKKAIERRILIEKTGISDKNISAKLNSLEVKGLTTSERTRKGRTVNRWVQTTKAGRDYELGKIVIERKPKKIPITKIKKEVITTNFEKKYIKYRSAKLSLKQLESDITSNPKYSNTTYNKYQMLIKNGFSRIITPYEKWYYNLPNTTPEDDTDFLAKFLIYLRKQKDYWIKNMPEQEIEKPKIEGSCKIESEMSYDEYIQAKPLPESVELKKELRLLINLVLTHRKEEYSKYGYKSVSEIRSQIDTLIDELGR